MPSDPSAISQGTEPYVVEDKKFEDLLNHTRTWRNILRRGMRTTLQHFSVFTDTTGSDRLLALGGCGPTPLQTVFTAVLQPTGGHHKHRALLKLTPFLEGHSEKGPPPAELAALYERQRAALTTGISSYRYYPSIDSLLYSDSAHLFLMRASTNVKRQVGADIEGFPMNAQLCPRDSDLVAFVVNGRLYVDRCGKIIFAAHSAKGVTSGCSSFVAQEELDRFIGVWWNPGDEKALVYETVDEREVTDLQFTCPGHRPSPPMKYPVAGTPNAKSSLRLVVFNGENVCDCELTADLKSAYPWYEYISRVGWLPDGSAVWVMLLSRLQEQRALVLIPRDLFAPSGSRSSSQFVCVLQNHCRSWFDTDNLTRFLSSTDRSVSIIHSEVRNDYTHLMFHRVNYDEGFNVVSREQAVVTSGQWSVSRYAELYVDTKRKHVYFVANKYHPADSNFCVTSYERFLEPKILTEKGLSCRIDRVNSDLQLNPDVGFVSWESSLRVPPRCAFYRIRHHDSDTDSDALPNCFLQYLIYLPDSSPVSERPILAVEDQRPTEFPELIEYVSANSSRTHYGLLMRPMGYKVGLRYPVLQVVYGGPGVQFVKNVWNMWVNFQKFTSLGYVVVMVDGRGSANRGVSFESSIKFKLGTVEVDDQVEGLNEIAKKANGLLDLGRVAIMGWSYGGYMSLLCLAKHPSVYRAAIAGGAVTSWRLYDTAYTERYLGLPSDPVYKDSSVIEYVNQLPNETDRLLVVHGLMDENVHFSHTERLIEALIAAGKPYALQIFPSERHGVRSPDANEYHDAAILAFLRKALSPSPADSRPAHCMH